jgi:hypothetical protein
MSLETVIIGEEDCENPAFPGYWYWAALPYTIQPTIFGDDIFPDVDIDDVVCWCTYQFGRPQGTPEFCDLEERRWRKSGFTTFHFRNEKDRDWQ